MRVMIIDDERNSVELITNLLNSFCQHVEVVATANSVQDGFKTIQEHTPDLVFLDVQMQDGTGFDLLKCFEKIEFKVIFVTAHQEFAIEAFRFSASDYLLKPLSPPQIMEAVKKAEASMVKDELNIKYKTLLDNVAAPARKKIVLKTSDRIYSVGTSEIIRFESEGSYTRVFLQEGKKIMVSRLIKEFDSLLSTAGFARVHQSHLINMEYLFCYEKQENHVVMKDNSIVPVAARKKDYLMELINAL